MRKLRNVLAGILALCVLATSVPMQAVQAEEGSGEESVMSFTCQPIEIIEGTNGYYVGDGEEQYYYYDGIYPSFSITFSDGTSYSNQRYGVAHDGTYYSCYLVLEQSYQNQLGVGVHSAEVRLVPDGYSYDQAVAAAECQVSIVENPIERIECYDVTCIEALDGYWQQEYDFESGLYKEFWYYDISPKGQIYMKDGSRKTLDGSSFEYNGETYWMNLSDVQSYDNQWGVGTHTMTAELLGIETSWNVIVEESPFVSLTCEVMEFIEGTHGNYEGEGEEEFYYYNSIAPRFQVTLKDGSVLKSNVTDVEYNGEWYSVDVSTDQSYQNPWGVGTHTATATFAGLETEFEVHILENPIERIECDDVTLFEELNGHMMEEYDYETDTYNSYWYYSIDVTGKVYLKDGSEKKLNGNYGFSYNGVSYYIELQHDQSYTNQWGVGTHTATASLCGVEAQFEVVIEESPIESVTCKPMTFVEGSGTVNTWNGAPYMEYYLESVMYDVTFSDGTVLKNCQYGIYYKGQYFSLNIENSQSSENQWEVGQYTATATLGSVSCEIPVTITASPIVSVEATDMEIIVNTNGQMKMDYEIWEDYYHYEGKFENVRVTFEDGSILTPDSWGLVEYDGLNYDVWFVSDQSYQNQWGLGAHQMTVKAGGATATANVTIVEDPHVSLEVLKVAPVIENQNCYIDWTGRVIYDIPEFSYRVTLEDGSSFVGYYTEDVVEGDTRYLIKDRWQKYYTMGIEYSTDQENKPWTVGTDNYFTISYAGVETQVQVEVKESEPYEYYEEDGEIYLTGLNELETNLTIPDEIDGKPVVAVLGLGIAASQVENLVIPDSVRTIAVSVFVEDSGYSKYYFMENLKTVTIGSGVTYLSNEMFLGLELTEITVSEDNVYYTSIDGVVYDKEMTTLIACPQAKAGVLEIPNTVTNIDMLFEWDDSIVSFPEYNFAEDSSAFVKEDGVLYDKGKTRVLFCDRDKKGEYVMPNTVTRVEKMAFDGCTQLTGIKLSDSVTDIAYGGFAGCTLLTELVLPESVKSIGELAFGGCSSLETVIFPKELQTIGGRAFARLAAEEIELPENLKTIESSAFYGAQLKTITIPDSVTSLGIMAFAECEQLESVVVGKGVTNVSGDAFRNCTSLKRVEFRNTQVRLGNGAFAYCNIEEVNLENVSEFGGNAFVMSKLTSVEIPDGVTEIVYGVFYNSRSLSAIDIPESVTRIGARAFDRTAWLIEQAEGPVYLEQALYTYKGEAPESVVLKDGTTVLADCAFDGQKTLKEIELPEGLVTIGDAAFWGCTGLTEIYIPKTVSYIGESAFGECSNLTAFTVDPDNPYYQSVDGALLSKDGKRLIWCAKQTDGEYVVPKSVEVIETSAFGWSGDVCVDIQNPNTKLEFGAIGYVYKSHSGADYWVHNNHWNNQNHIRWINRVGSSIKCYENSPAHAYAEKNLIDVTFKEAILDSIEVAKLPTKSTYMKDTEALAIAGGRLNLVYSDGTKHEIDMTTDMLFEGFDNTVVGTNTITVTYEGKQATFDVEILSAKVSGYSISLKGDVAVNFYMSISQEVLEDETAYMQFTDSDGNISKVPLDEAKVTNGKFAFSFDVQAPRMNDEIKAQIITSEGVTKEYTYSVKEYADYIIEHEKEHAEYQKAAPMVKAMMNFGGYSQKHFGHNVENLANEGLYTESTDPVLNTKVEVEEKYTFAAPKKDIGLKYYGSSLLLDAKTTIRHYFTITGEANFEDICANYTFELADGTEYEPFMKSGKVCVDIKNINAKDLDEIFTLTINNTADETNFEVSYSPLSYAKHVLDYSFGGSVLMNLIKAMCLYNSAANKYFG